MAYMHKETFVISQRVNIGTTWEVPDEYFEIDDMMALPIQLLNRKGYLTGSCCSGHPFPDLADNNYMRENKYNDKCYISFIEGISLPELPPEFYIHNVSYSREFALLDKNLVIYKNYDSEDARETMKYIFETMEQLYEWALTLPEYNHIEDKQSIIEKIAIADVMKIAEEHIKSNELDMKLTSAEYVSDSDDIKLILYFTTEHEPDVPKERGDGWVWANIDSW